jgi:hypothetical protein
MREIPAIGLLCALAGCDLPMPSQVVAVAPTTYHDVSYYDAHPVERDQTNAWCRNNPGLAKNVPSCDSADTSDIHAWNRQMGWAK